MSATHPGAVQHAARRTSTLTVMPPESTTLTDSQTRVDEARTALDAALRIRNTLIAGMWQDGMSLRAISAALDGDLTSSGVRFAIRDLTSRRPAMS